jgi:hypothetical protein
VPDLEVPVFGVENENVGRYVKYDRGRHDALIYPFRTSGGSCVEVVTEPLKGVEDME